MIFEIDLLHIDSTKNYIKCIDCPHKNVTLIVHNRSIKSDVNVDLSNFLQFFIFPFLYRLTSISQSFRVHSSAAHSDVTGGRAHPCIAVKQCKLQSPPSLPLKGPKLPLKCGGGIRPIQNSAFMFK